MRQISAQKDVRALIAHKYGCHLPQIEAKMPRNGNTVTSQPVTSPKAERARWEMETAVSEIHKTHVEKHRAEHLTQKVDNASDERKNAELREHFSENFDEFLEELKNALHCSFIVTYAGNVAVADGFD